MDINITVNADGTLDIDPETLALAKQARNAYYRQRRADNPEVAAKERAAILRCYAKKAMRQEQPQTQPKTDKGNKTTDNYSTALAAVYLRLQSIEDRMDALLKAIQDGKN